jgi:hypothetical protein
MTLLFALLLVIGCTTDRTRRGYLLDIAERLDPPQRDVIVIPGFGVTRLFDPIAGRYVWGTARNMMRTDYEDDLDLDQNDRLVPTGYAGSRGPVNVGWQLTEALRKYGRYEPHRNVHPFYYDWRRSARENASRLAQFIDQVAGNRKVDLVTHSAGALIALTYVKLQDGGDRVDRLVMIAPPRRGVVDAFRVFVRPERFLRREFTPETVSTWPFVYELLPDDGRFVVDSHGERTAFDAWDHATWPVPVNPALLEDARRFRDDLASARLPAGIRAIVLAGDCVPTARHVLRRDEGTYVFYLDELTGGEGHLAGEIFEPGDGTVLVSSAAGGIETRLFCDGHQGIATDPNVHRAILRALR